MRSGRCGCSACYLVHRLHLRCEVHVIGGIQLDDPRERRNELIDVDALLAYRGNV